LQRKVPLAAAAALFLLLPTVLAYTQVTIMAPAVARTPEGWIGVASYITVHVEPGEGRVFVDTFPLTQIDTQGSARLATEAATSLIGVDPAKIDVFIVIRSDSAVIGGPSAGGAMSVAILASLLNKTVDPQVVMTGTINPDGTIGPIGGVLQKAEAANSVGAKIFLVPRGQTTATETPTSAVLVNVTEYAKEHWNLTVREVDDLRQAAKWIIGVEIERSGGKEVDLEKYNEIMSRAAEEMIDSAQELCDEAKKSFQQATLTYGERKGLKPYLDDCLAKVEEARKAKNDGDYYVSASYAFQAKTNATYVSYALRLFKSQKKATARNLIQGAEDAAREAVGKVNQTSFTSITAFECFAAAESRAHEAMKRIERAWEFYYRSDLLSDSLMALREAAYIKQRAESALWWVSLCSEFPGELEVNRTAMKQTAEKYLADLKYLLAYAESMASSTSGLLTDASNIQDDVEREIEDGTYAAAVLDSLRARSYVNTYLELAPIVGPRLDEGVAKTLSDRVEREKEVAYDSIAASRAYGVNPILALSYYEFGVEYADKAKPGLPLPARVSTLLDALLQLKYARLIAEMSPIMAQRLGSPVAGAGGVEVKPFNRVVKEIVHQPSLGQAAAIASVSIVIGLAIGIVAGRRNERKSGGV